MTYLIQRECPLKSSKRCHIAYPRQDKKNLRGTIIKVGRNFVPTRHFRRQLFKRFLLCKSFVVYACGQFFPILRVLMKFFVFCFCFFIYLFLFCFCFFNVIDYNIYRTNTYTTYSTNIILTSLYIYIALLILTVFKQANRTNTYTTYNTSNIICCCFL